MGFIERIRNYALSKGYYKPAEESYEEEADEYEEEDEEEEPAPRLSADRPSYTEKKPFSSIYRSGGIKTDSKVYSINSYVNSSSTIVIAYPESIDESGDICDCIKSNNIVVVNLDTIRFETAQRIVDFVSGVVHALDGDIQYISNKIFIIAPKGVDITGRIKEELKSGGILASLKASFR